MSVTGCGDDAYEEALVQWGSGLAWEAVRVCWDLSKGATPLQGSLWLGKVNYGVVFCWHIMGEAAMGLFRWRRRRRRFWFLWGIFVRYELVI